MDEHRDSGHTVPERDGTDTVYSDAYYRKAPDTRRSCYGYSPAQCYAHASDTARERTGRRHGTSAIAAVCVVLVLLAGLFWAGGRFLTFSADAADGEEETASELYEAYSETESESSAIPLVQSSTGGLSELSAEGIYTEACRSTVGVTVPGYAYNVFGQAGASAVVGSGVILSGDGYILTNFHVIEAAYETGAAISVIMYDETEYEAEVVGVETDSDLAVLKIEAEDLTPAVLGDSDEMRVGQTIYAVGNPLGELTFTMTSGIVSALDRRVTTDVNVTVNMFQIDAAVNNGNSGGPVFNAYGQVIGIVTAKYSLFGMEGLGFAIPINDACRIACDLVDKGYVTGKAYLGLKLANVSPSVAQYYDMVQGVYIYSVEPGSCAEAAGLRAGDIITAIGAEQVATSTQLVRAVKEYRAGDSAMLTVCRGQTYITVTVVFDEELPAERAPAVSGEPAADRDGPAA